MSNQKVVVLGAGRVGSLIARDLAEHPTFDVTIVDRDPDRVESLSRRQGCASRVADLTIPHVVREQVADAALVVGALPGHLGLGCMEAVVSARVPRYVDISFLPEDPRAELGARARQAGVTVLYDMGVAPGMSNLLLAAAVRAVAPARWARYLVGGLPVERRLPWEYEAPFSPVDVVEEYTRPARFKRGGRMVTLPALSEPELFDFEGIGTLEGFLTDGLRSLLDTVDCPDLQEKTLRYPGHAERIRLLRDSGFFSDETILVGDCPIRARDATFAILEGAWQQGSQSEEFTLMRIEAEGGPNGHERIVWQVLDRRDPVRGESSMARTTGFPAAIAARGLLQGWIHLEPGVHPPETLARDDALVERFVAALKARGVRYERLA